MKINILLLLVTFLSSTRGNSTNEKDNKIAPGFLLENNTNEEYNETQAKTLTTITEDDIANEDEAKQVYQPNGEFVNVTEGNIQVKDVSLIQRSLRNTAKADYMDKKMSTSEMECFSCYGSGSRSSDQNCFSGNIAKTQKCADVEQCFTELHPQYIKRGCALPSSINRTFVCKCPLCNDKPSEDLTYYEYRTFNDWEYDNKRLKEPVVGLDLLCKVCETRGVNKVADKNCRLGKNADYMQCGHEEMCFTNIDSQIDFVSRGCISMPAFNSLYYLCTNSKCNNLEYPNPRKKRTELTFKAVPLVKVSSSCNERTAELILLYSFIVTLLFT